MQRLGTPMTAQDDAARFGNLQFTDFQRLATDPTLSRHEKIGFPDAYREGFESSIHADIVSKLPALRRKRSTVLDIGCGCSGLPRMMVQDAERLGQRIHLVDSAEMLALLPEATCATKTAGRFPDCPALISQLEARVDALLVYSVLQYEFAAGGLWPFLDAALGLLAPGGRLLLGDLPNVSMRRRFFSSAAGRAFHLSFTGRDEEPPAASLPFPPGSIDDAVVLSIIRHSRDAGFHAYVVPQPESLPMHNRREDILVVRP
jgi:SAM-dependent methyltransferase